MTDLTELVSAFRPRDPNVWDALWRNEPIGRIAVAVAPGKERLDEAGKACADLPLPEPDRKPAGWTDRWRESLLDEIAAIHARMQLPGDFCPAVNVPGFLHGQSQGICDLFGARVEPRPDGLFFVHPLSTNAEGIEALSPRPIAESMYWGAVEWIRYARAATNGLLGFRNPVMTGPLDTANYLLGTMGLMEWMYGEPKALGRLLEKITDVIVRMIRALRDAAGGELYPETFYCMRGGFTLCSECRSLLSLEHYEQFEAPYLRRIGEEVGDYGIHSCGSWERTLPSGVDDPNLRAMHGQVRENDLDLLCRLSAGRMTLGIWHSENLSERYIWPDMMDFYAHVLATTPPGQPIETQVREDDVPFLNETHCHGRLWEAL